MPQILPSKFQGCVLPRHPLYAEALDDKEFARAHSPIVKAAYDIACEVHGPHPRNTKRGLNKPIAYMTHPIMVCKFLGLIKGTLPEDYANRKHLTDDVYLATALLHDVLEEKGTRYYHQPDLLEHDLCERMVRSVVVPRLMDEQQCSEDALNPQDIAAAIDAHPMVERAKLKVSAHEIVQDCVALCNPEEREMLAGKRVHQVRHMDTLTSRQKLIKMLDQMASVTEDLLFESSRDPQKIVEFFYKALDVVKAGAAVGADEHKLAEEAFLQLFKHFSGMRNLYQRGINDEEAMQRYHDRFAENFSALKFYPLRQEIGENHVFQSALAARVRSLKQKSDLYAHTFEECTNLSDNSSLLVEVAHPAFSPVKPYKSQNETDYAGELSLPDFGCVIVKLVRHEGKVCVVGYSMAVPDYLQYLPDSPESRPKTMLARKAATYLAGTLELQREGRYINIADQEPHEGDTVRDYWLSDPLDFSKFREAVAKSGDLFRSDLVQMLGDAQASSKHNTFDAKQEALIEAAIRSNNPLISYSMIYELSKAAMKMQFSNPNCAAKHAK